MRPVVERQRNARPRVTLHNPTPDPAARRQLDLAAAIARRDLQTVVSLAWAAYYAELAELCRCRGIADDQIADVVQDTFARVVEGFAKFNGERFSGWLFDIARYTILTYRKARSRAAARESAHVPDLPDEGAGPLAALVAAREYRKVEAAAALLDPADRLIFEGLCEGVPDATVAERIERALGQAVSPNYVAQRRFRIRKRLAAKLQEGGEP